MLIPLILLGIGYSIYVSVIWACIPFIVPEKLTGTAYGLADCFTNIGGAINPLLAAQTLRTERQGGYFWMMIYFNMISIVAIVLTFMLFCEDFKTHDGVLDKVHDDDEE